MYEPCARLHIRPPPSTGLGRPPPPPRRVTGHLIPCRPFQQMQWVEDLCMVSPTRLLFQRRMERSLDLAGTSFSSRGCDSPSLVCFFQWNKLHDTWHCVMILLYFIMQICEEPAIKLVWIWLDFGEKLAWYIQDLEDLLPFVLCINLLWIFCYVWKSFVPIDF